MEFSSLFFNISPKKKSHIPNVISIKPDRLITNATNTTNSLTGTSDQTSSKNSIVHCKTCDAVLTSSSRVGQQGLKYIWTCEFCEFENLLDTYMPSELPGNDNDILLNSSLDRPDNGYFIFCVDVSKSMGEKSDIPNDEHMRKIGTLSPFDIFENRQSRISKFRSVEMAISDCISRLGKNAPNKRVGLVAFSKNVEVIGDGRMEKLVIDGQDLNSTENIKTAAENTPHFNTIEKNKEFLINALDKLKKHKSTALGPALYYSVLIASRSKGSQVLLCTDGQANKGLGALDKKSALKQSRSFYNEITNLAVANGVSVSIVTLEGSKCNLSVLIDVVSHTKGYIRIVKPFKLRDEFYSVIEKKILVTNARVVLILPKQMNFKSYSDPISGQYKVEKEIGNVTDDSEIQFQVEIRDDVAIDLSKVDKIPIQMQFYYDSLDGAKHMRLIVQYVNLTQDDELFEENVDRRIVGAFVINLQTEQLSSKRRIDEIEPLISTLYSNQTKMRDNFSAEEFNQVQNTIRDLEKELTTTFHYERSNSRRTNNLHNLNNESMSSFFPSSPLTVEESLSEELDDSFFADLQRLKKINSRNLERSTPTTADLAVNSTF